MESMRLLAAPLLICILAAAPEDRVRGAFDAAARALSAGDLISAERGFQEVLKTNPRHIGAIGNLGVVYSRLNRTADAIRAYRAGLKLAPEDPLLNFNLALAHLKQDNYQAASPLLRKVLAAKPDHLQAKELLATTQIFTGEVDSAVKTLESLRSAENTGTLYFLSVGYLKQGRKAEARRAIEDLFAKLKPAQASFLAGRAYYESAIFDEAVAALEKARDLDPQLPGVWRELGKAYVSLRKSAEARAALAEAVKHAPEDEEASYFLGALYVLENREIDGIPRLEKTRGARPDFWGSYYYLGRARLQLGELQAAVRLLEKAADLNPDEQSTFFQLSRALKLARRDVDAERATQRFRELVNRRRSQEQEALVIR